MFTLCGRLVSRQNFNALNVLKIHEIKKSGLATALSINYPLLLSLVCHNLLCHGKTGYAELIFDMGYTLEAEVFGARKEFAHILRAHAEASGEVGSFEAIVLHIANKGYGKLTRPAEPTCIFLSPCSFFC